MAGSYGGSRPLTERPGFMWAAAALTAVVVFLVAVVVLRFLFPGSGTSAGGEFAATSTTSSLNSTTIGLPLAVELTLNPVPCDGTGRDIGRITGVGPGETVTLSLGLTADPTDDIALLAGPDRVADLNGDYVIRWSCTPEQVGRRWEVTATTVDTARAVTFTLDGAIGDSAASGGLTIVLLAPTFACDSQTKPLGTISGAEPGEAISFSSPQAESIRSGTADAAGNLDINWNCNDQESSVTWTVTATGETSGRTGEFTFSGEQVPGAATTTTVAAPTTTAAPTTSTTALSTTTTAAGPTTTAGADELAIAFSEQPFGCDGQSRPFAVLSNLSPGESVTFTSPDSSGIRPGTAADDGTLTIRWQCSSEDVDSTWTVTATGDTSNRSITFTINGAAPG